MSILDSNTSFVYGDRDIEYGMMNIGLKTPEGEDKTKYVSSISSEEYWKRRGLGKITRCILFCGDTDTARTVEWFGLGYGTKVMKEKFYNIKNNAHCINESLLTPEIKQIVIDFIENNGKGIELEVSENAEENQKVILDIFNKLENAGKENSYFTITQVPLLEVYSYNKNQVREVIVNQSTVSDIKSRMEENPALSRQVFSPIVVVVTEDGNKCILDGNTHLEAGYKAKGWRDSNIPVVYINESEFGSNPETRKHMYNLFGLYLNKEDDVIRVHNSDADLLRNIHNFLVDKNLDLTKELHINHARTLIYDHFQFIVPSKTKLNGLLTKIINEFNKSQSELRYQKNIITYNNAYFATYAWRNYEQYNIATVHATVKECAHAAVLAYIQRRMKNVKVKKGAIILHYTSKVELDKELKDNWIKDLQETIDWNELDIVVDVLPAFSEDPILDV